MSKAYLSCGSRIDTASNSINKEEEYTASDVRVLDFIVPAGATAQLINFVLPYANLKVLCIQAIWATGLTGVDATLKTNSSGAPAQTFTLKPNVASPWHANSAWPCPITTNITALYAVNPDATNPYTLRIVVGNNA